MFVGVFQMKVGIEQKGGQDDKSAQKSAAIFHKSGSFIWYPDVFHFVSVMRDKNFHISTSSQEEKRDVFIFNNNTCLFNSAHSL